MAFSIFYIISSIWGDHRCSKYIFKMIFQGGNYFIAVWFQAFIGGCLNFEIRVVTPSKYCVLESPQWSSQENVLYYVDIFGKKITRYDPRHNKISSRNIGYGIPGFVVPVRGYPGSIVVGVRNGVYLLNWGAPPGDKSLRLLTVVDVGKPDNLINDGKVDARGSLWFGTFGQNNSVSPPYEELDQGSLYMINNYNYRYPEVKIRPVSVSNGIAWATDNTKMYYIDSQTRKIAAYDFILDRSQIGNRTIVFDFNDHNIPSNPDGMTIDIDGNLWVATFQGAEVLKIDPYSSKLLQRIRIPADIVTSVMWGDKDLSTLYVTTGKTSQNSPTPLSGSLLSIHGLRTRGAREPMFVFPNAKNY